MHDLSLGDVDDFAEDGPEDALARRPDEGAKPYRAFTIYASIPAARRSLSEAYRLYAAEQGGAGTGLSQDQDGADGAKRAPVYFRQWSSRHQWLQRAEAADRAAEAERRRVSREELAAGVEAVRAQTEATARVKQAFFARVSQLLLNRLDSFEARDRRAAEAESKAKGRADDGTGANGRRRKTPTPTPVSEVLETVKAMRALCLVSDSGKADAVDSSRVKDLAAALEDLSRELEERDNFS